MLGKGQVHHLVIGGIYGAGGAKKGYAAAFTVQHHGLADILFLSVEGHDVARGGHPQWQVVALLTFKVGQLHHQFMTHGIGGTMPAVVHHQRAILQLLFNQSGYVRVAIARARRGALVGIPVNLIYVVVGVGALYHRGHLVGGLHVRVVVAVVAHHAYLVLPRTGIFVLGVADNLIHQCLRLVWGAGRQTTNSYIGLAGIGGAVAVGGLYHLLIIQQTEEIVADVAVYLTERVLALVAQQIVVGIVAAPLAGEHTVVPSAIAKQQQVARLIVRCGGTVVQHFQIAAVGSGIGGAAAELVIQLVGRYDGYTQSVVLLMVGFQAFGLCQQVLTGGDDNHHIGGGIGMVILIGDAIHIGGLADGDGGRLSVLQVDVVQSQIAASGLGNADGVLGLQVLQVVLPQLLVGLGIAV